MRLRILRARGSRKCSLCGKIHIKRGEKILVQSHRGAHRSNAIDFYYAIDCMGTLILKTKL